MSEWFHTWVLAITATLLSGWWLAVRPGATYRGAGPSVSFLIIAMAGLMCVLAFLGQGQPAQALHLHQVSLRW